MHAGHINVKKINGTDRQMGGWADTRPLLYAYHATDVTREKKLENVYSLHICSI